MQKYIARLLNFRKNSEAIHKGTLIHFAPSEGIYLIYREYKEEQLVLILNKNTTKKTLQLERFRELNLEGKKLQNIVNKTTIHWEDKIELNYSGAYLFTTKDHE